MNQLKTILHAFHLNSDAIYQKPLVMGILNVTPDSFSDGGRYADRQAALTHARAMITSGADLLDIGGESSKPNAAPVSVEEELSRVIPIIESIRRESTICLSIDTVKPQVMRAAVAAGVDMINDISALQSDEALATAVELAVPVCLMHMQGDPATMQQAPSYPNGVVQEINQFFVDRVTCCVNAGIRRENLILDPGFGFGKTTEHNLTFLKDLAQFQQHQLPLLLGVSRKSTLGKVSNKPVNERLIAGIAVAVWASLRGVAIIRTHDVAETVEALTMIQAIELGRTI